MCACWEGAEERASRQMLRRLKHLGQVGALKPQTSCAPWGLKPQPCHCTQPTARRGPGSLSCSLCAGQGTEQGRMGAGGPRTLVLGAGPLLPESQELLPPAAPCSAHTSPTAGRDITDADHQSSDLLDSSYWGSILHPSNLSPWQQ